MATYPTMPSEDDSVRMYRFIHEIPSCCPDPAYSTYLSKLLKAVPLGPAIGSRAELQGWVNQIASTIADHHGKPTPRLDFSPAVEQIRKEAQNAPRYYRATAIAFFVIAGLIAVQDRRL